MPSPSTLGRAAPSSNRAAYAANPALAGWESPGGSALRTRHLAGQTPPSPSPPLPSPLGSSPSPPGKPLPRRARPRRPLPRSGSSPGRAGRPAAPGCCPRSSSPRTPRLQVRACRHASRRAGAGGAGGSVGRLAGWLVGCVQGAPQKDQPAPCLLSGTCAQEDGRCHGRAQRCTGSGREPLHASTKGTISPGGVRWGWEGPAAQAQTPPPVACARRLRHWRCPCRVAPG